MHARQTTSGLSNGAISTTGIWMNLVSCFFTCQSKRYSSFSFVKPIPQVGQKFMGVRLILLKRMRIEHNTLHCSRKKVQKERLNPLKHVSLNFEYWNDLIKSNVRVVYTESAYMYWRGGASHRQASPAIANHRQPSPAIACDRQPSLAIACDRRPSLAIALH